jgi:hypothetical protein
MEFFYGKYNFRPLVGDTDGFNCSQPIKLMIKYVTGKQPTMVKN